MRLSGKAAANAGLKAYLAKKRPPIILLDSFLIAQNTKLYCFPRNLVPTAAGSRDPHHRSARILRLLFCFVFQRHFAKTKRRSFCMVKQTKAFCRFLAREVRFPRMLRNTRTVEKGRKKRPCAFSTPMSASGCKDFTQTLSQ